jgi:hypothetical protein
VLTEEPDSTKVWHDLAYYKRIRPFTPWILPLMPLLEIAYGCFLPQSLAHDPGVQELNELGCLIFGLFNDVASLEKDDTGLPCPNAVLMHRHHTGATLQESVTVIAEWTTP